MRDDPQMNGQSDDTSPHNGEAAQRPSQNGGIRGWLRRVVRPRNTDGSPRDTLEELIEEREEAEVPIDEDERSLLANVLELKGREIEDIMVPRADVIAVECQASLAEVTDVITGEGHSRLPVYRETLDDAMGMVHIKDVLAWRGRDDTFQLSNIVRKVLFVAPSMQVLELLLEMRVKRIHMALVVDEYGGVDGLVTIEDLVEEIVGEIEDEHDQSDEPEVTRREDGTIDADARVTLETMEDVAGSVFSAEERENIDTLGGLVFSLAGRVPIRGELVNHPSGLEFQVIDADPRRIKRLRVRLPAPASTD